MANICSDRISLRLPEPLRERLEALALHERRSMSNTVRILIERALAEHADGRVKQ